jgi:hypothetical protein
MNKDDDDTSSLMHSFDRVSIPAVLISDDDTSHVARSAGIHEPIVIPVIFGDDATVMLGDRFTPNLTGVFEPEEAEGDDLGGWHLPGSDEA